MSGSRRFLRMRATTVPVVAWTLLGAAAVYWGYHDVMASCPELDDFAGCFEPPYRFAASVALALWLVVEIPLVVVALAGKLGARGDEPDTPGPSQPGASKS